MRSYERSGFNVAGGHSTASPARTTG